MAKQQAQPRVPKQALEFFTEHQTVVSPAWFYDRLAERLGGMNRADAVHVAKQMGVQFTRMANGDYSVTRRSEHV